MSNDWEQLIEKSFESSQGNTLNFLMETVREVMDEMGDLRTPLNEKQMSNIAVSWDGVPEIPLTEIGWNKMETEEGSEVSGEQRKLLESYLNNIAPGGGLTEKIQALDDFYESGFSDLDSSKTTEMISKTLSFLVFYKTLTRIITNFNAASAGFTFESFLATLLDGSQIKANTGTIADFLTGDDIPISLKLYAEKSVSVDGSFTDLVRDLTEPKFSHPAGGMRYVVCTKSLAGQPGQQEGKIRFYEFDFTLDNVMDIISRASRLHSVACIILPLMEDENGKVVLLPDAENLQEPVSFTNEEIDEKITEILSNREVWEKAGFEDYQIENILNSQVTRYDQEGSLELTKKGTVSTRSTANKTKITELVTNPETGTVQKGAVSAVFKIINDAIGIVAAEQAEINARRGTTSKELKDKGVFPKTIPKTGAKDPKSKAAEENIRRRAEMSREWYNQQDEDTKRRALRYTYGYVNTHQFGLNREEATSEKVAPVKFIGEINIGSSHIMNVISNCQSILNESIFDIFYSLKSLTENINQYFANGLREDDKAKNAIEASQNIETRTKEVSGKE
jgi:hypothetical protein